MDYSVEGRPVELSRSVLAGGRELPAGTRGRAVVDTTIGETRHLRLRLDVPGGPAVNVPRDAIRWLDEVIPD